MFGKKKKPKKVAVNNTTEALAIEFLKRAVGSINAQLEIEVERNGFSLEDLKKGRIKLERTLVESESDSRFKGETFSIINGKINRIIMCVKWSPNSYVIEVHSEKVANAVRLNPSFGIKKNDLNNPKLVLNATSRDVEIAALAAQKKKEYLRTLNPN